MSNNYLSNFLDREKLEKKNLASKFFLGRFLDLKQLRALRVGILRLLAAQLTNCELEHKNNGDEEKFQDRGFVGSFTKGLPHDPETGQVDSEQFKRFRVATHKGDFFSDEELKLGKDSFLAVKVNESKPIRAWESPAAGLTFEMHGPDSHSVTMPSAPELGSDQLTFEMAEVYWLALLRDIPFNQFQSDPVVPFEYQEDQTTIDEAIRHLNNLPWFQNGMPTEPDLERRQRKLQSGQDTLNIQTVFRGKTIGDIVGPYLSQFLLIGSPGHENNQCNITNGLIEYGALKIDQKLVPARLGLDHMTTWKVFIDVQDGANVGGTDVFKQDDSEEFLAKRFITYPRDLATYVHFDALYEAYLNACLILLDFGAPVDSGIAQLSSSTSPEAKKASASGSGKVDGFALFGGPHILNLVTEVATRALKAVRYQKFNVHCRLRPEALAGWIEAINQGKTEITEIESLKEMYDILNSDLDGINLLAKIKEHNGKQNAQDLNKLRSYLKEDEANNNEGVETALLPMAFPEGSPMHPAYGAGHATVAGACVTMIKAFFDNDAALVKRAGKLTIAHPKAGDQAIAYVSTFEDGDYRKSMLQESPLTQCLTVGGELNKLAANISIGRNMAGVHYYTDYIDSLVMGERIAIGILLEQSLAYESYPEKVRPSFSLTTFLGTNLLIKNGKIFQIVNKVLHDIEPLDWCKLVKSPDL